MKDFAPKIGALSGVLLATVVAVTSTPATAQVQFREDAVSQEARKTFDKLHLSDILHSAFRPSKDVCTDGEVQCFSRVLVDDFGVSFRAAAPTGYSPAQLLKAYSLPGKAGAEKHPIIAIVDAYGAPTISNDLAVFDRQYGLPTFPKCVGAAASSAIPCLEIVDEHGGTLLPPADPSGGWELETALDVEVAHSLCSDCSIVLVQANAPSFGDLGTAEATAFKAGANVVSNSWGTKENASYSQFDANYRHPGTAVIFSSGDSGYGATYPAEVSGIVSVGGTTLVLNPDQTRKTEVAWAGTGGGCSAMEPKPGWQHDPGCHNRMQNDVAADADPITGFSVYDSYPFDQGTPQWITVGGTSFSAPIIAAVYAQSHYLPAGVDESGVPYLRGNSRNLFDVVSGSDSPTGCTPSYFCTAQPGYDGPTGLGTPIGVTAF